MSIPNAAVEMSMSELAPQACPVCGGRSEHAFYAQDRNRKTTQERFTYARCTVCETIFLSAPPANLSRYYEHDYYQFGLDKEPIWRSEPARVNAASYRVALLKRHISSGHLIEIGAGTGAFAVAAKAEGFEVSAIEMDERCCQYLSEREKIKAICSDRPLAALESLPPANAVAMWHVLEHLENPVEVIERIAEQLEPGGLLAIGVPNPSSLQFRLLGKRWMHLDAPRHLFLIPPAALVEKGRQAGLQCVAMTTNDPDGLECNLIGWINALRRRPANGSGSWIIGQAGGVIGRALAPLERSGYRGSAITLLMRKDS